MKKEIKELLISLLIMTGLLSACGSNTENKNGSEVPTVSVSDSDKAGIDVTKKPEPATTEEIVPATTEEIVPATTEEIVPATTEEIVPATTEETVPATTEMLEQNDILNASGLLFVVNRFWNESDYGLCVMNEVGCDNNLEIIKTDGMGKFLSSSIVDGSTLDEATINNYYEYDGIIDMLGGGLPFSTQRTLYEGVGPYSGYTGSRTIIKNNNGEVVTVTVSIKSPDGYGYTRFSLPTLGLSKNATSDGKNIDIFEFKCGDELGFPDELKRQEFENFLSEYIEGINFSDYIKNTDEVYAVLNDIYRAWLAYQTSMFNFGEKTPVRVRTLDGRNYILV